MSSMLKCTVTHSPRTQLHLTCPWIPATDESLPSEWTHETRSLPAFLLDLRMDSCDESTGRVEMIH
jgi:hypothetical protein